MDIQLPLMDGYEATRRIKSNPEMKEVPIIAVTSYALAGDEAKAEAAGCNAYANNLQQSWRFDGEPPKAVLRDIRTMDRILGRLKPSAPVDPVAGQPTPDF